MKHPALILAAVTAIALSLVAGINAHLANRIDAARQAALHDLQTALLTKIAHDSIAEEIPLTIELPTTTVHSLTPVKHKEKTVAWLLRFSAKEGYGGEIELIAALTNLDDTAPPLRVIRHSETPGIADFLTTATSPLSFDGISGATITVNALQQALAEIRQWLRARCADPSIETAHRGPC